MDKLQRQIELEEKGQQKGIEKFRDALMSKMQQGKTATIPGGVALLHQQVLTVAMEVLKLRQQGTGNAKIDAALKEVDAYSISFIALQAMAGAMLRAGIEQTKLAHNIGYLVFSQYTYQLFKKQEPYFVAETIRTRNLNQSTKEETMSYLMRQMKEKGMHSEDFDVEVKVKIGLFLIDSIITATGLFKKSLKHTRRNHSTYYIRPTEELLKRVQDVNTRAELFAGKRTATIIQPKDWKGYYGGGFHTDTNQSVIRLVRAHSKEQKKVLMNSLDFKGAYLDCVNHLQRTPFKINSQVLDVLKAIVELGGGHADIPPTFDKVVPIKPWGNIQGEEWVAYKSNPANHPIIKQWKEDRLKVVERVARNTSKRLLVTEQIATAEQFREEPELFFVWNLDWRGRVYPVSTFLHPQGNDTDKGLLLFAKGKPLGRNGLFWFKVHGSNTYGVDKVSFEDRLKWVDDNKENILATAKDPMDMLHWWEEADSPFMFLAFCFEYQRYVQEGESFVSYLPIGVDGSNNGLQHLSAMLLDPDGARATNLLPSDKPADIYQEVIDKVKPRVFETASKEFNEAKDDQELKDIKAAKKIVSSVELKRIHAKRNTMTYAYSVTARGMVDQLQEEFDWNVAEAHYLARENKKAIEETVSAAKYAMEWLQYVAREVSNKANCPISWTTPSGFKVIQDEKKRTDKVINTFYGGMRLQTKVPVETQDMNPNKQALGISPNFVHSYDAAHMHLTVCDCVECGVDSFMMIHDSYATHACDMDCLYQVLREKFVEIYSEDVLESFRQEVQNTTGVELLSPPPRGAFDIDNVIKSKYFFA